MVHKFAIASVECYPYLGTVSIPSWISLLTAFRPVMHVLCKYSLNVRCCFFCIQTALYITYVRRFVGM